MANGSNLFASILKFVSNVRQLFAADDFSRQHFQMHFVLGALRVKRKPHFWKGFPTNNQILSSMRCLFCDMFMICICLLNIFEILPKFYLIVKDLKIFCLLSISLNSFMLFYSG